MRRTAIRLRSHVFRSRITTPLRLEERAVPAVVTFQQGVIGTTDTGSGAVPNGFNYNGTQDTDIRTGQPTTNYGLADSFSVDTQDGDGLRQGLLRFDNIFGNAISQVPFGAKINSAKLTVVTTSGTDTGGEVGLYRMRQDWNQSTATASSFLPVLGVQTDGIEAESFRDWILPDNKTGSGLTLDIDVTNSLQAWATGTSNFGWLADQTGVNGWDFATSDNTSVGLRPKLTVDYTLVSGPGTVQLAQTSYEFPEPDTGSATSTLLVTRFGGLDGSVSVNYTISPISATAGVDYDNTNVSGTVIIEAGKTNGFIPITLQGDTVIEGPEKFKITLSSTTPGVVIGQADTVITIADNDLLISEIVANMTNLPDDGYEYVEITGAPGLVIPAGTYLTAFNSEVTVPPAGAAIPGGIGTAQVVVDLSGKSIGSNGLLIVTPTNFNYTIPSATTRVIATQLDAAGGGFYDGSISFVLVSSPLSPVVQGVDYDISTGTYVDNVTPFLNDGILDTGPFDPILGDNRALFLDSVGSTRGPNGRAERVVSLARPGVRVTIPSDHNIAGEVARYVTDGYTRINSNRQANNTGSWYNGEILGATTLYSTGLFSSGRTPPGGQISPGDFNLPRGIVFETTSVSVNETAGTVTVLVNRSGDSSIATSIDYASANVSALAGQDYTAVSGTLFFGIGVVQQPIIITLNNDSTPEGFESFVVNLSNPGAPFALVTPQARVTITDDDASVATFQDGDLPGEYNGTRDAGIYGWQANDKLGSDLSISVDRSDDEPTDNFDPERPNQALIRFNDLFGNGPGQVPVGSIIFGGFVTFFVTDGSDPTARVSLHRMLVDWDEATTTFNNPASGITNGITLDDVEARATPDGIVPNPSTSGVFVDVPVSIDTLQAWANGTTPNYGWTIQNDATNGWDFDSLDTLKGPGFRPKLTLVYSAPAGAGSVRFEEPTFVANEDAGTATLVVQRPGATTGTVNVNWAITSGSAVAADYTGPTSGVLTFGPTDLSKTISIPLVNDSALEANETIIVTLSGAGVNFTRNTATLVIRDNDFNPASPALLLNEFLINPSGSPDTFEYAELVGTPNAGMGNLYVVALTGSGSAVAPGNADVVIDLSQFTNGSNGYTLARGINNYAPPAGTTDIILPAFSTNADNFLNEPAISFVLIYSPVATIAQGYDFDWDNSGTLNLPTGAVIVDAVSYVDQIGNKIYGGNELVQSYRPQAISRLFGDSTANTQGWFRGSVLGAADSLTYSKTENTNLPVPGAALTPGRPNTAATAPLTNLVSSKIDEGSAQRSMVRTISLTFANPIDNIASGAFALSDQNNVPVANVAVNVAGVGTNTLTLSFAGSPIVAGSLADGLYRITVDGGKLYSLGRTVDAKNDTMPGTTGTVDFHRLAGDSNGDRTVDSSDFLAFRLAFLSAAPAFDFDGNGSVDTNDFLAFRLQFLKTV